MARTIRNQNSNTKFKAPKAPRERIDCQATAIDDGYGGQVVLSDLSWIDKLDVNEPGDDKWTRNGWVANAHQD